VERVTNGDRGLRAHEDDAGFGRLGPRLLTFAEAIGEISRATGREIGYVHISAEQYVCALEQDGVPPGVTELLAYLFTDVLDGRNAYLTDGVRRALGRDPKDFGDYARDAAASGVWDGRRQNSVTRVV
jgi:hypothetical protein